MPTINYKDPVTGTVTTHNFPDGVTDAEIQSALESDHPLPTGNAFASVAPGQQSTAADRPQPSTLDYIRQLPQAAVETAAGLATSLPAQAAGFAGEAIAPILGASAEQASNLRNNIANTLTYKPYSPVARGAMDIAGGVGSIAMKPAEAIRNLATEKLGPDYGRMIGLPVEAANALLLPKLGEAPMAIARSIPESLPRNIATRVLKPSTSDVYTKFPKYVDENNPGQVASELSKRVQSVDNIVKQGDMPTQAGLNAKNQRMVALSNEYNSILGGVGDVNMQPVYDAMLKEGGKKSAGLADKSAYMDVLKRVEAIKASHGDVVPADVAHSIKVDLTQGKKYGQYTHNAVDVADKAGASELNSQLKSIAPGYEDLNKRYNAEKTGFDVLRSAEGRLANNSNILGKVARGGAGTAIGYALGGPAGAAIGGIAGGIIDTPLNKMRLANTLEKARQWGYGPQVNPGVSAYGRANPMSINPNDPRVQEALREGYTMDEIRNHLNGGK